MKVNDIRPSMVNTHTHTPWTHTRSSGQSFMLQRPGSSWGFGVLLKGLTSVVVLKVKRALYIHSPTYNSCQTWDSNSQPFDYESNSLTIRPRLPRNSHMHLLSRFKRDLFNVSTVAQQQIFWRANWDLKSKSPAF